MTNEEWVDLHGYIEADEHPIKYDEYCEICGQGLIESNRASQKWESFNFCDSCFSCNTTINDLIEFGKESKEKIELNGFIAGNFTKNEIEEILLREIRESEKLKPGCCRNKFIKKNEYEILEWLEIRE